MKSIISNQKTNVIDKSEYLDWLKDVKYKIYTARTNVALSVNTHLHKLYWELGKDIVIKQKNSSWGTKLIEQMSIDLKHEFPDIKGFSRRNLYAIRQWYLFFSKEFEFVPHSVAQIPWGHNRILISKLEYVEEAIFYANAVIKNGWKREILEIQIEKNLFARQGKSITNFRDTLPEKTSKIAQYTLKDPYNFDFLGLGDDAYEREVEKELTRNITEFLIELGKGFAYIGRQVKLEISDNDYFIDLLFYHLELRCYIVIELKAGKFKPEYTGKLNFYLSAVDTQIKKDFDNPTIGILLCRKKDKIEAEYALRDINKPMGISEYRLADAIPEKIKTQLPTIEELENQLVDKIKKDKKNKL